MQFKLLNEINDTTSYLAKRLGFQLAVHYLSDTVRIR